MRRVSKGLARSLAVAVVVSVLAAPVAEARSRDSLRDTRSKIVKIVKKWFSTILDELSEPKP